MRKREITWIIVLILLGLAYVHFFTSVGVTRSISITPSLRPLMGQRGNAATYPVYFTLDEEYCLTSLKVTTLDTSQAKPQPRIVWELTAKDGSSPIKFFAYGQSIAGMFDNGQSTRAEVLQPDVVYHLELKAGRIKGERDFQTRAMSN